MQRRSKRFEIQAALLTDTLKKEPPRWATVAYAGSERRARKVWWRCAQREGRLVYRMWDNVEQKVVQP